MLQYEYKTVLTELSSMSAKKLKLQFEEQYVALLNGASYEGWELYEQKTALSNGYTTGILSTFRRERKL